MTGDDRRPVVDLRRYSCAFFDVDGTVVVGSTPTPGAPEFVAACRRAGLAVGFITNASMRTPAELLALLERAGVAEPGDYVLTSAVALAQKVRIDGYREILCAGHSGLSSALAAAGLVVHDAADTSVAAVEERRGRLAVALGLFPDQLPAVRPVLEAALSAGCPCYVPTLERSWPTPDGLRPGNGATVDVLRETVDVQPIMCGKPSAVFAAALRTMTGGPRAALVVGDTWAVDVALARAQGWDSLLTLTGTTAADPDRPWMNAGDAGRPWTSAGAPTYVASCLADVIVRT
jgi:Predicted sugar phosphatases of the HAD superfamily